MHLHKFWTEDEDNSMHATYSKDIACSSKEDVITFKTLIFLNLSHSIVNHIPNHYNKWTLTSRDNFKSYSINGKICNVNKRSLMNHNDNPLTKGKYERVCVLQTGS